MNYEETLSYLFAQLPMYQKIGMSAYKKDLTRTLQLCEVLDDPQKKLKCIHVAGTNGKGTTSHLIAAMLQAAGYKVGLYTSPHYKDFRERIKVNGVLIDEQNIIDFVAPLKRHIERIEPSFFEITVVMAFDYFVKQEVDFAVIETGLGGRLDSTNVVDPILSVITHISLDHQNILGPTVYHIAKEKAGIIKSSKPLVIGRYQVSCDTVFFEAARAKNCIIEFASLQWQLCQVGTQKLFKHVKSGETYYYDMRNYRPFFDENVITSLEALRVLRETGSLDVKPCDIQRALEQYETLTTYIGRWQLLAMSPMTLADSAHNIDALSKILAHLETMNFSKVHFVLGFVNDKDLNAILEIFPKNSCYYFARPNIQRGLDASILRQLAESKGLIGEQYDSVREAIEAAQNAAAQNELIYIGGSSFVVAEAI